MVEFSMILSYFINILENKRKFRPDPGSKLMEQVREVLRYHHYAYRTEKTCCDWIVLYIKYFDSKKRPRGPGANGTRGRQDHRNLHALKGKRYFRDIKSSGFDVIRAFPSAQ